MLQLDLIDEQTFEDGEVPHRCILLKTELHDDKKFKLTNLIGKGTSDKEK